MEMRYDPLHYPYPSRRYTVFSARGMVAASEPRGGVVDTTTGAGVLDGPGTKTR